MQNQRWAPSGSVPSEDAKDDRPEKMVGPVSEKGTPKSKPDFWTTHLKVLSLANTAKKGIKELK